MKWKDCHYKHNYGNTRPAGRKRKRYENAAPELQISLSFFPRSFRGGTPRSQTWGRGWFPGRTSGEKLLLPVLELPRDFSVGATGTKSSPSVTPERVWHLPQQGALLAATHHTPKISRKLRYTMTNQATNCIPAAGVVHSSFKHDELGGQLSASHLLIPDKASSIHNLAKDLISFSRSENRYNSPAQPHWKKENPNKLQCILVSLQVTTVYD